VDIRIPGYQGLNAEGGVFCGDYELLTAMYWQEEGAVEAFGLEGT
jgi:hypothetical protein